jgi:hypothetical protein
MKKTLTKTKLSLDSTTLRRLTDAQLATAQGGAPPLTLATCGSCVQACETRYC